MKPTTPTLTALPPLKRVRAPLLLTALLLSSRCFAPPTLKVKHCLALIAGTAVTLSVGKTVYDRFHPPPPPTACVPCNEAEGHQRTDGYHFANRAEYATQAEKIAHNVTFQHLWRYQQYEIGAGTWEILYYYSNLPSIAQRLKAAGVPRRPREIQLYLEKPESSRVLEDSIKDILVYLRTNGPLQSNSIYVYWDTARRQSETRRGFYSARDVWKAKMAERTYSSLQQHEDIGRTILEVLRKRPGGLSYLRDRLNALGPAAARNEIPLENDAAFAGFVALPRGYQTSVRGLNQQAADSFGVTMAIYDSLQKEEQNHPGSTLEELAQRLFAVSTADIEELIQEAAPPLPPASFKLGN